MTVVEFVAFEPNPRCTVETVWGPVPYTGTYECEGSPGGTRLTVTVTSEAGGFFRVTDRLLGRLLAQDLRASLGVLKDLLEAGGADAQGRRAASSNRPSGS